MADDDNYDLFDKSAFQPRKRSETSSTDILVIRKGKGKVLSKEQRTFNRLTRRIAELERRLTADREKLDTLLSCYHDQVAPVEKELARRQVNLVRALAAAAARFALQKRQKADLREMLLDIFDDVFAVTKPDTETEALYDKWADTSYQEEVRREAEILRRRMAASLKTEYDIKVDVSEYDDSPEAMARFLHNAREKVREAEAARPQTPNQRRRRPKQEDLESQLREREALTKKSVRAIYLSLAKVLHPDTITDATERSLREDFMKQATFAYGQGDIAALLKLELRWVTRDEAGTSALPDESLRAYIPALHEQLARAERAVHEQMFDPRYEPVGPVVAMAERTALALLRDRAKALREVSDAVDRESDFVASCTSKRTFTTFVRDYFRSRDAAWDIDEMMMSPARGEDDWF